MITAKPIEGFTYRVDDARKARIREQQSIFLERTLVGVWREEPALIVLDEMGVALTTGMAEESAAGKRIDASLEWGGKTVLTFDASLASLSFYERFKRASI